MPDTVQPEPLEHMGGKKFLFQKPELLSNEDHGSLGFTPQARPYDFVKSVRAIPLTMTEFSSAQRHYPITFSRIEDPVPLAIVGLSASQNLFVDDSGNWDSGCYLPSYLRCHPFAFATELDGRMAVVVDRAAASVTKNPQYPFFVDGQVSEHTNTLMQFCAQYDEQRKRTQEFCKKLVELDLLAPLRASYTPEGSTESKTLAEYVGINLDKLNALDSAAVFDLHKSGFLSAIYLQFYSLENWRFLRARSTREAI